MRIHAIATDYDGTLAEDGRVARRVVDALFELRRAGRKLMLVTGRELDELLRVFPVAAEFDCVVAENGALLYTPHPGTGRSPEERPLGEPLPHALVTELRRRGVGPIACGRIIVATWEPHAQAVRDAIAALGLQAQVIFNKGAIMILPRGIDKGTGLVAAARHLGLAREAIVGIGDAENDCSLFAACGVGVAVDNALPVLKARADFVTTGARGDGVIEVCRHILADDMRIALGAASDGYSDVPVSGVR